MFMRKHEGESADWTLQTELQASQVDLLQVILRILQIAHLENPPTDQIQPVRRPNTVIPEPETKSLDALGDFLKGQD
jgi:hypothetical protein